MTQAEASVAIIGGSGLYEMLSDGTEHHLTTPYGEPSSPITVARVGPVSMAFLTRHGRQHEWPPHRINYRANAWALRSLGVRRVLAPCAVGSLRSDLVPGSLVVPDQLVDWTHGREQTFHHRFDGPPQHARFADPYCAQVRAAVTTVATERGWPPHSGGAMVVIDGPRFSTRAESRFFAQQGWLLVNMTGHPEAVLCRELGMCYAAVALVTDLDAGLVEGEGVDVPTVLAEFARSTTRMREVLLAAAAALPDEECRSCTPVG